VVVFFLGLGGGGLGGGGLTVQTGRKGGGHRCLSIQATASVRDGKRRKIHVEGARLAGLLETGRSAVCRSNLLLGRLANLFQQDHPQNGEKGEETAQGSSPISKKTAMGKVIAREPTRGGWKQNKQKAWLGRKHKGKKGHTPARKKPIRSGADSPLSVVLVWRLGYTPWQKQLRGPDLA